MRRANGAAMILWLWRRIFYLWLRRRLMCGDSKIKNPRGIFAAVEER